MGLHYVLCLIQRSLNQRYLQYLRLITNKLLDHQIGTNQYLSV